MLFQGDPSPQTVSYEYLELVQLSEKYKEESILAQEDVIDDNGILEIKKNLF